MKTLRWFLIVGLLGAVLISASCDDDDGESDSAELCDALAGGFTFDSVTCDGKESNPPPDGVTIVFQDDCLQVITFADSSNGCVRVAEVQYSETDDGFEGDPRPVTCSDECDANQCVSTADSGDPFPVRFEQDGDTIRSIYDVTQQIVENQLTPCEPGEEHITTITAN